MKLILSFVMFCVSKNFQKEILSILNFDRLQWCWWLHLDACLGMLLTCNQQIAASTSVTNISIPFFPFFNLYDKAFFESGMNIDNLAHLQFQLHFPNNQQKEGPNKNQPENVTKAPITDSLKNKKPSNTAWRQGNKLSILHQWRPTH